MEELKKMATRIDCIDWSRHGWNTSSYQLHAYHKGANLFPRTIHSCVSRYLRKVSLLLISSFELGSHELIPFEQESSKFVMRTFFRITGTKTHAHHGIEIVDGFSLSFVFAVIVDHPQQL